jgi:hypothetical protein
MNTYFYAASSSKCQDACSYETCSRRCLSLLEEVRSANDMVVLPGGSQLQTPISMDLRSGDILILYAGDKEDLDALVSIKDVFDTFRVILIVGEDSLLHYGHHYRLTPHFTMALGNSMDKIGAVIDRINDQPQSPSTFATKLQECNHG